jgi:hypothetical protein
MINAEKYRRAIDLLEPLRSLWSNSILHAFPEMEALIPEDWFSYGARAELEDQYLSGQGKGNPPDSLRQWIRSIHEYCAIPGLSVSVSIRPPLDKALIPKKKHEVEAILSLFRERAYSASRIIDIGGGLGHLARHLSLELNCPVDSIDRGPALQAKAERLTNEPPWSDRLQHKMRFIHGEFPLTKIANGSPGAWAIGLHTCGATAWSVLDLIGRGYSVLNVGCCYEKLTVARDTERSHLATEFPLQLTNESLFLANRGGIERSLDEFTFQQRVQRYRFALHELLKQETDGAPADSVGSAEEKIYMSSFADYARDRLSSLGKVLPLSDGALDDFFCSIAPLIEKERFTAFLRNLLARPLELAILLDRALYIEESFGIPVHLIELFDPRISPRNIGLIAVTPPSSSP